MRHISVYFYMGGEIATLQVLSRPEDFLPGSNFPTTLRDELRPLRPGEIFEGVAYEEIVGIGDAGWFEVENEKLTNPKPYDGVTV